MFITPLLRSKQGFGTNVLEPWGNNLFAEGLAGNLDREFSTKPESCVSRNNWNSAIEARRSCQNTPEYTGHCQASRG